MNIKTYRSCYILLHNNLTNFSQHRAHRKSVNKIIALMGKLLPEAGTRGVLCKKVFLEILQNPQENTCVRVSFLIKLGPATLLKKRLWHRSFPANSVKFLRTPFLQNISGRLLLYVSRYLTSDYITYKTKIKFWKHWNQGLSINQHFAVTRVF